jgi:GntR family transcriptional regulator, transcriptional repressor for pyruvate dehydrogenase complex
MTGIEADVSAATVRSVSGYQAVVDAIRREISLGRIRVGERLPAERQLAQQLGVSRETVRQAIRVLEGGGQVIVKRGAQGGAFIQASAIDHNVVRDDLIARRPEILEHIEYRGVIESGAAALAAERRSAADLAEIIAAQEELRGARTIDDARHADTRFHLAIAAASGNDTLARAIEEARVFVFRTTDMMPYQFLTDSSVEAHEHVFDAIEAGDPEAAARAMEQHIATTRREFLKLFDGARSDPV